MMATTFEDRLERLAADGAMASAPKRAPSKAAPTPKLDRLHDAEQPSSLAVLGACFAGGFLGLILATIVAIGRIEGSPWGPGSELSNVMMLPALALSLMLVVALIPSTIFFRRAQKSFAFVASSLAVLMIGFLI